MQHVSMVKFEPLNRVDRQIALLLFALVTAVYLRMSAPGLLGGDPGEFHFAAWNFGLSHPTGYPLYMLIGGLWQHLWALLGVEPARALNALSAVTGGAAASALFLLMRRWVSGAVVISRAVSLFAALMLAVNPTMWSQSLIAEVYALHALFIVLIFLAAQSIEIAQTQGAVSTQRYALLFLLLGFSLAHHGMTLLLLPGLLLYLQVVSGGWWRSPARLFSSVAAMALPLLLYLYIPLRSGPDASPWYHQRLGDGVLTLYDGSARAFVDFISGRSISVGFLAPGEAFARLGEAFVLWRIHYNWPGLVLIAIGLGVLLARREQKILALTLPYLVLQHLFNLFYAIDDILVYYIPLYVIASIWVGFAADFMAGGVARGLQAADSPGAPGDDEAIGSTASSAESSVAEPPGTEPPETSTPGTSAATPSDGQADTAEPRQESGLEDDDAERPEVENVATGQAEKTADAYQLYTLIVFVVLLLLPLRIFNNFRDVLDQSQVRTARDNWDAILAARPPDDAILVSNDRNEIVPLFYIQYVEGRRTGNTGLFPLIKPGAEFADIGATLDTTLARAGTQPVYLVKPMDGLEIKFALEPATPPLVRVTGPARVGAPAVPVAQAYGPLTLLGYDLHQQEGLWTVVLHWQVDAPLAETYTTSVQIFGATGEKLGQDDRRPGGDYYPTSAWKVGEVLLDPHTVPIDVGGAPTELLINMYAGPQLTSLAEPLRLPVKP